MIPDHHAFQGQETFVENGKTFYRSYRLDKSGKFRLTIKVIAINSAYRQAIAFSLSAKPKFKGSLLINGTPLKRERKQVAYVIPVELPDRAELVMDIDAEEGHLRIANASDFLDDYPELIERISAQTGRTREQFRGCSYASGFSVSNLYGNAFWMEQISDSRYRFHCNDHKLDEDFDDLIFDLEIENISEF